jgi:cytochrome c553
MKSSVYKLQRQLVQWSVLAMLCGSVGSSLAVAAEGNAAAGKTKTAMCAGCHGIPGYKVAFPVTYEVPKLGGQHASYIVKALQAYRVGDRKNATMHAIATGLSDQDMADLAAYYSSAAVQSAAH